MVRFNYATIDSIEFYKFFYEDILKKSEEEILGYSLLKDALVG